MSSLSSSSSFDEIELSDSDVNHIEVPRATKAERRRLHESIRARTDISEHAKEDLMIEAGLKVCTRFCKGCVECQGLRQGSKEKDYFVRDLPPRCKKCAFRNCRCKGKKANAVSVAAKKANKSQVPKSRYFMLSIWDTSDEMRHRIKSFEDNPKVKKFVCQEEICPTTGRHHFQAYIALDNAYRTSWVHKLMATDEKCGIKFADGNHVECYKYCTKKESRAEDGFSFEFGDFENKKPGKR